MSKVAVFLNGGRYGGDRASVAGPAPEVLVVSPCDGSCRVDALREGRPPVPCGMATHWHDLERADELGDAPRHAAYYVLVDERDAPSGMSAALYLSVGHERPTGAERERARREFDARQHRRGRAQGAQTTTRRGQ